ncbi:MAG: hypothetical protein WBZ37_05945, partial [Mycobacterium sp.]
MALPALPNDPIGALQALGISNPVGALQGLATAAVLPGSIAGAYSLINGVVGVGTSLVSTVTTAAIAVVYLENAGILPKNLSSISLPSLSGGLSIPALQQVAALVTRGGLSALPGGLSIPALQAVAAPIPQGGLPALPGG